MTPLDSASHTPQINPKPYTLNPILGVTHASKLEPVPGQLGGVCHVTQGRRHDTRTVQKTRDIADQHDSRLVGLTVKTTHDWPPETDSSEEAMLAMGCADAGMPASPQSQTHACILHKKRVLRWCPARSRTPGPHLLARRMLLTLSPI